jgi:energy-converting hydrogenase A subunit R
MLRVFATDAEGPFAKNDNAYEIASRYIPNGDRAFSVVSKYDDVLADVQKRSGYNAGDTLKLMLPLLKGHEVTDKMMKEFSGQKIQIIRNTEDTLENIRTDYDGRAFIISTSYEQYVKALCDKIDFPFKNTYCTKVDIDNKRYAMTVDEKLEIKKITQEIASMPKMKIPDSNNFSDFSDEDKKNIQRLDQIFWGEIAHMKVGRMLDDVIPVGGMQKAEAIRDISRKTKIPISDVMYVGDSITDVEAFKLVNESGGLTISFNGNGYAVRNALVGIMSETTIPTEEIAYAFNSGGTKEALSFAKDLDNVTILSGMTSEDLDAYVQKSSAFRKQVRTEEIGTLG